MENAPFSSDIADGPEDARSFWLTARDGVRIRISLWGQAKKGTVLLLPGRTEFVEKYGRVARILAARGYATLAIDWRGQGLADRLLDDPNKGHVTQFTDYQMDLDAVIAALPKLGLDADKLYLIAHSMGGCIGLRAVMEGLKVRAAVFSAPMWGLPVAKPLRLLAHTLSHTGLGRLYVPGNEGATSYAATTPFEGNTLTSDAEALAFMQAQTTAHPELALGAPTLQWATEAFAEMAALEKMPSPDLPAIGFTGADEEIVTNSAVKHRMARWSKGQYKDFPGARHEIMMERADVQNSFFERTFDLFEHAPARSG
ncbi:hypothetical protein ATO10_14779 [Actibacterium atlanticum]|uniref:Serine aminopeptidase S33 domain-containing protein n=1 Tax=Actibacterium atlanticum TaxID=1461693 RepID=A0A058ZI63_9RHOB|nr:alpha/beta hydrolase [Actibacterium atlanticum]KCV80925.1 hypothetical protein ATO10_14779 [Actibacterium atlanticum]